VHLYDNFGYITMNYTMIMEETKKKNEKRGAFVSVALGKS
jgi:hypothetical protein